MASATWDCGCSSKRAARQGFNQRLPAAALSNVSALPDVPALLAGRRRIRVTGGASSGLRPTA